MYQGQVTRIVFSSFKEICVVVKDEQDFRVVTLGKRQSKVNDEQGKNICAYHDCRRPVE